MKRFTMTHTLDCDVETFWKLTFDRALDEKLVLVGLGFPSYELLELEENEREIVRRVRITPKVELPAVVQKALGGNFSYAEELRLDRSKSTARITWTPESGKA